MGIIVDQPARVANVVTRTSASARARRRLGAFVIHATLVTGSAIVLLPFVWMLSTSLKEPGAVFLFPPQFIPDPVVLRNYVEAMTVIPFNVFFRNTAFITFLTLIGQVLSSSIVAYSFARLRWKGRDALFVLVLATMMLPRQVTLIPQFILFRYLGWIDTFYPLIVPAFFGAPFYVFLLRQFFMSIPLEMDDAARIDGCDNFGIYWRMVLPLSRPALAAVAIFSFQYHWNDFFEPLIYLHSNENYTVSLALRFFHGNYGTLWHLLMAASNVAMAPIIILFFVAQRYFIQGVVFTGVKG